MSHRPPDPPHPPIRDGFPGQRMLVVPQPVVHRALAGRLVSDLLPTDIGYFPNAAWHDVSRDSGAGQMIIIYCVRGLGWAQLRRTSPGCAARRRTDPSAEYGARLRFGGRTSLDDLLGASGREQSPADNEVTSTVPVPAGEVAVTEPAESAVIVPAFDPKSTALAPPRLVPVMVTLVPPPVGPADGLIAVTDGAAT